MLDKYQSGLYVFFSGGNFDQIISPYFMFSGENVMLMK